jgi:hypothetical protein
VIVIDGEVVDVLDARGFDGDDLVPEDACVDGALQPL